MLYLQSRWKLEGRCLVYYGLRNKENLFRNRIRLGKQQAEILRKLPCTLTESERRRLGKLLGVQVVSREQLRTVPRSLDEAVFCKCCAANDFILPGLEFDREGLCPICQTRDETAGLKSIVPIRNQFPRAKRSRFDVALFYTGGKDSTYLLYELSVKQNLRVLALTWEIPYMSDSARRSIENAKTRLPNVEFITRFVCSRDLQAVYRSLYQRSGNACACPSLAYALFYPELVANRVPYFIAGNEPAQLLGLYYNHMAPKMAYRFPDSKGLNFLVNVGRLLTLHPPLKPGQFHTLTTMRFLAYGRNGLQRLAGYENPLVANVVAAIHAVPGLVQPLKRAIRTSSRSGNIPAFVQVDLNAACGGYYDWQAVRDVIIRECGWVPPEGHKGLHTSCKIEKCKEHSQFIRFYRMESTMLPFSALELSIASRGGSVNREQAIRELRESLGFSLEEVAECALMREFFRP